MHLKSFSFRIMVIAFLGTHVPLLAIVFYLVAGPGKTFTPSEIILVTLAATLAAAIGTLLFVNYEVSPVREAARSLADAQAGFDKPYLPDSNVEDLQLLFKAIRDSFGRAQYLTERQTEVMADLSAQLETLAHNTQSLAGQPDKASAEQWQMSNYTQIDRMREIIDEMRDLQMPN